MVDDLHDRANPGDDVGHGPRRGVVVDQGHAHPNARGFHFVGGETAYVGDGGGGDTQLLEEPHRLCSQWEVVGVTLEDREGGDLARGGEVMGPHQSARHGV